MGPPRTPQPWFMAAIWKHRVTGGYWYREPPPPDFLLIGNRDRKSGSVLIQNLQEHFKNVFLDFSKRHIFTLGMEFKFTSGFSSYD